MSFVNNSGPPVSLNIKRGYTYGPRTFLYRHGADWDTPNETFENDGYEAQLEVTCTLGGESVLALNTEDSGSGLTIDPDEIIISLELSPADTAALVFDCCDFVLFIYKGDVDDPDEKVLLVQGEIVVSTVGAFEVES